MNNMKHTLTLRMVKLLAVILETVPFAVCWYVYYAERIYSPFYNKGNWLVIALFAVVYTTLARIYDAFRISANKVADITYSHGLAALLADCIMFVVICLLTRHFPNPLPGLGALTAQVLLAMLWAMGAQWLYFKLIPPKKSAIIYDKHYGIEQLIRDYDLEKKFDIRLIMNVSECTDDLQMLADMETVFVSGVQSHARNVILKYCIANGITVYVLPRIGDIILSGARRMHMFHLPMLRVTKASIPPENAILKRCFDIVASTLALIVASPVMLITAIAIKLDDGGPIFYTQDRLTRNGRVFKIVKFRSMRVDAEKDGVARLSTGDKDDRITPVGRIIRKLRIDELPQLINIISGHMSIVGPRPERPEIAAQYEKELPEFRLRLQVKAGLTGYAQVYGTYSSTPYDKLQMDLMYIANPSILEDLRIIVATIKVLFQPESTDGIQEGQITAAKNEDEPKVLTAAGKK